MEQVQQTGLRLELSERVHLRIESDIVQLETTELTPKLHMTKEEPLMIRGQLALNGTYTGATDATPRPFEHAIVVSMHVPDYRIADVTQVGVMMESLDIHVVGTQSLEVLCILHITGVERISSITDASAPPIDDVPSQDRISPERAISPTTISSDVPQNDWDPSLQTDGLPESEDPVSPFTRSSDVTTSQHESFSPEQHLVAETISPTVEPPSPISETTPLTPPLADLSPTVTDCLETTAHTTIHVAPNNPEDTISWSSSLFPDASEGTLSPLRFAVCQDGDTWLTIATRYGMSPAQLMATNDCTDIERGDVVLLPKEAQRSSS